MYRILVFIIVFLIFIECQTNSSSNSKESIIPVPISIERFDQQFHRSKLEQIPNLKKKYPFLFPKKFSDSVWIKRQKDSLQLMLLDTLENIFPSMKKIENELGICFGYLKSYFPETKIPRVVGLINNVDYQSKIIYVDSLLLISLDTFFGSNHVLYSGIPKYVRQQMDSKYLASIFINKFAESKILLPTERTLLSQMIYHGKKLYIKDILLPNKSDFIKICYTQDQIEWVKENEIYIWQYFIEKQFLYNTAPSLIKRFIDPAPFSKFYLDIDNESPGRVGQWIGWQIIRSYVKRFPETDIVTLLNLPSEEIFKKSNYKPRKK